MVRQRILGSVLFLVALLAACGGEVTGVGQTSVGGGGGSSGGGSGGGGGVSTGGGGGGSGGSCVTVQASSFSQSCNTASDCTLVTTGTLCSGECACGETPISNASLSAYNAATASVRLGTCPCPDPGVVECLAGTCTLCDYGPGGEVSCGSISGDAGVSPPPPPPDAATCVDVSLSSFSTSCSQDSDCIQVTTGMLCSDSCLCGGSSINETDEAEYDQLISPLQGGPPCACPYFGQPTCVQSQCTICGTGVNQPGCPDAGP